MRTIRRLTFLFLSNAHTLKSKQFVVKQCLSPEIHAALNEVCETDTVDRSTVQRWHQRFRDGRISIDNNPRSGRPSTVTHDNYCLR